VMLITKLINLKVEYCSLTQLGYALASAEARTIQMRNIELNNWSPLAEQVLHLAKNHAREHGHKIISTGHLLAGLCRLGQGSHVEPLRKQGFDESKCLAEADEIARQQATGVQGELDYSDALIGVAQRAQEIARRLDHKYVGTEQLALALLQAGDEVGSLLANSYKLDANRLELDILNELGSNEDPIRRFARLVLFVAQRDHATDLVMAPASGGGTAIRECDPAPNIGGPRRGQKKPQAQERAERDA